MECYLTGCSYSHPLQKCRYQNLVKMTVVSCPTVVDITIVRPDLKFQLGFTIQDGVVGKPLLLCGIDSPLLALKNALFSLYRPGGLVQLTIAKHNNSERLLVECCVVSCLVYWS